MQRLRFSSCIAVTVSLAASGCGAHSEKLEDDSVVDEQRREAAGVSEDFGVGEFSSHCGDGVRNPASEECDDGLSNSTHLRGCTAQCRVIDHLQHADSTVQQRHLGAGRHPASASSLAQAVVSVDLMDADVGGLSRISISTWSPVGEYKQTYRVADTLDDSDPVIAALADGSFAVAYSSLDADGDGLGIGLARIPASGGAVTLSGPANATTVFGQHSPDILFTSDHVIVAWQDDSPSAGTTVCHRRFDSQLAAVGAESCEPDTGADRSHIVLAAVGSGVGRAWREDTDTTSSIVVAVGGSTASFTLHASATGAADDDAPALAGIDAHHLLLVYTSGAGSQMAAVVDDQAAVVWGPQKLSAQGQPRYSPALAVPSDGIYLAWREPAATPSDPDLDELYLEKLAWNASTNTLEALSVSLIPLPRQQAHLPGSQLAPALAATPLAPSGAILAAWDDETSNNYTRECPHGDVAIELIPTPVLRKAGGGK